MVIKLYSKSELSFFSVYIDTAEKNHLQEAVIRPKGFEGHHIFSIADGEGILIIGGAAHCIKKGDMVYISSFIPHSYHAITSNFRTNYITFFGDGVEKIKSYYDVGDYEVYQNQNSSGFEKHLNEIITRAKYSYEVAPLCALTESVVIDFFESVRKKTLSPIEAVYKFIETNYSEMLTLEEIMIVYPYSKSKLCSDFKNKYGVTIFDMITDLRLRKAHHMISLNLCISNREIANGCGFRDVSYFCKMYKRKYGTSPKAVSKKTYINESDFASNQQKK